MTTRSTVVPLCLVYCSARPCQNGRVWSLLYSAITTLIERPPPSPHPASGNPAGPARSSTTIRRVRRRLVTAPYCGGPPLLVNRVRLTIPVGARQYRAGRGTVHFGIFVE